MTSGKTRIAFDLAESSFAGPTFSKNIFNAESALAFISSAEAARTEFGNATAAKFIKIPIVTTFLFNIWSSHSHDDSRTIDNPHLTIPVPTRELGLGTLKPINDYFVLGISQHSTLFYLIAVYRSFIVPARSRVFI
jgi:hypothetical protein